jgi:DNA-binding response OmpR family regulator
VAQPQRILIVADKARAKLMREALEHRSFAVAIAPDYLCAYDELLGSRFDLVIIELGTVSVDHIDFIRQVRKRPELAKTLVLVLGEWGTGQVTLAMSQGADACEPLPLDADRLATSVSRLLNPRLL